MRSLISHLTHLKNPTLPCSLILFALPTFFYNNDTYLYFLFYQVFACFLCFQLASLSSLFSLPLTFLFMLAGLVFSYFTNTNTLISGVLFSGFLGAHLLLHYLHPHWKSKTTIPLFQAVNFGLIASFGSNALNQPFAFSFFILYFLFFLFGWSLRLKWLSLKFKHSTSLQDSVKHFKIPSSDKTALRFFPGISLDTLLFVFGGASLSQVMQMIFNAPSPFILLIIIPFTGLLLRFFYSYSHGLYQSKNSSYESIFLDPILFFLIGATLFLIPFIYFIFNRF